MNKRKKISKNENKKTKKICELVKNDENSYLLNESFYECGKIKKILKTNYLKDSLFVLADNVIKVYSVFTSPMIFDQSINNPLNNVDEIMRFTNHNDEEEKKNIVDMCFKIGDNNKVDLIIYCIDGILKVINTKIISVELKIDIGIDQRKIFYDRERHVLFSLDLENNLMCWDLEKKCILKTMNMAGVLDIHFFHEQNLILVQSKNGVFSKMSFENIERTPSFEIIFCFEEIMNVLKLEKRSTIELKQIMLHENLFFILLSGGWFVVINFKGEVVFFYNIKDANCFDIFFHDSCKSYIAFGLTKGSCKIFKNDNASYSNFSLSGIIQIAKQTKPVNHVYLLKQSDMCFFVQDEKTKSKIFILKKSPSEEVEIIEK